MPGPRKRSHLSQNTDFYEYKVLEQTSDDDADVQPDSSLRIIYIQLVDLRAFFCGPLICFIILTNY